MKKSLGQNFLTNDSIIEEIVNVSRVDENDIVIEIGPGAGSMTEILADRAGFVLCIEIDDLLIPILEETVGKKNNVKVINADALKCDFEELIRNNCPPDLLENENTSIKCVANLPYYITTPLVMKILEEGKIISSMTLMMQKEVAERICAQFGSKDVGAITFAVKYCAECTMAFDVAPENFFPAPEVTSTVVKLDRLPAPSVAPTDSAYMFKVIKASFAQRRKTLLNGLANAPYLGKSKQQIKEAFLKMGIAENIRGEKLTLEQFAQLSDLLNQ